MSEEEQIRIKDYQVHIPPLGEGAFGKVFRATYRGISDRALKTFRPGAVDLATMARELEKLSQVAEHQGIVTLHDFDLLHEPPYYAMGLHADQNIDGIWETRTLERVSGQIDYREGWRIIREISDALAYLHRNQIVHCDIKPSNILLTDETPYHTKICDFGQSRGLAAEGFDPVGTPLYASPEQLRNPRDSADGKGFRWDVYSFGVLAFKLLTGELPRLQALAKAERTSFDPDATLVEASLEATMAESGNGIDGEQLATMTEAVEDITWPTDYYVPSARKELIEQCLNLDPSKRPADMREVWSRIQHLDQQNVVKKARRLNTIFATLLVVAIWASGFAFIQAQKARTAIETAVTATDAAEKNAESAMDLMQLFVSELNKGEISGLGADRLYAIVAENASAFLESRDKNRRSSSRILQFSAQTASLRGRRALEQGNLEEALKDFTSAYEIRSELSEDLNATADLSLLASRDLMEVGRIHELQGAYDDAIIAYSDSLSIRSKIESEDNESLDPFHQIRDLAKSYRALSRAYFLTDDEKLALSTLEDLLTILSDRIANPTKMDAHALALESIEALQEKGNIEYQIEDLDAASATFQELMVISKSLDDALPTVAEEGKESYAAAVNSLGRIQLDQEQAEAALVLFREEIKLREEVTRLRPYDPEEKVALALAYSLAAQSLELENESSRSLAIFYLEQAISLIGRLPSEVRYRPDVQTNVIQYNNLLSSILEMDE